jgi:hypothetical protein
MKKGIPIWLDGYVSPTRRFQLANSRQMLARVFRARRETVDLQQDARASGIRK